MPLRYFADLKDRTVEFDRVDYRPDGKKYGYDKSEGKWVEANRTINYKSSPSKHECDVRCMNANGRTMNCECRCGGRNHGRGSAAP